MASEQEHQEQKALVEWYAFAFPAYKEFLFAIPNGAYLGKEELTRIITMKKLKAEGLKTGVPDLMLALPSITYHGLFIEMKKTGSTWKDVTKDQKGYLARLSKVGYKAIACGGFDDARNEIKTYMEAVLI